MKFQLLFILLFVFACSGPRKADTIRVFAAASLAEVMEEVADSFEMATGLHAELNLAGTGTLARQIEQGAEADLLLSADRKWCDYLTDRNLGHSAAVFASNELVLITPQTDTTIVLDIAELLQNTVKKIAVGDPGYVPAGSYAQQVFDFYRLDLSAKLMLTNDVRSALMMVEMGEAGFGIVYRTDALLSKKVRTIYTFPEKSHQSVDYFQVLISERQQAKQFYDYLYSPEAKAILRKYQFKTD